MVWVNLVSPALAFLCLTMPVAYSYEITYGTPRQCDLLQISWTGSPAAQLKFPLIVHLLPFLSTATVAHISTHVWNESTTSGALSLPFHQRGGTQYLLSITDKDGEGIGPVSEVKTAADSEDTSCLGTEPSYPAHFAVQTTPDSSLCPSLRVSWDDTVNSDRPKIMAFSPGMFPVDLDPSVAAAPSDRVVTLTAKLNSKSQVVVLFDDKGSPGRTSELLVVGGTDGACLKSTPPVIVTGTSTSGIRADETMLSRYPSRPTNKAGIIIGASVASIVAVSAIIFAVLAYRQGRKRRTGGLISHTRSKPPGMMHGLGISPSISLSQPPPVPPKSPWATSRNTGIPSYPRSPYDPPPTPIPKSPSLGTSKRRSYITHVSSDASSAQYLNVNDTESLAGRDPLPDSATLPGPTFLQQNSETIPSVPPQSAKVGPYAMRVDGVSHSWSKKVH